MIKRMSNTVHRSPGALCGRHPGTIQRGRQHSEVQYCLWLISNSRIFLGLKDAILPVWCVITDIWIENPDNACKRGTASATGKQGGSSSHLCAKEAPPHSFWHHEIWGKQHLKWLSRCFQRHWRRCTRLTAWGLPLAFTSSPKRGSCSFNQVKAASSTLYPLVRTESSCRWKGNREPQSRKFQQAWPRPFKNKNKTWKKSMTVAQTERALRAKPVSTAWASDRACSAEAERSHSNGGK